MQNLLVEMAEMARQISAQLDTRSVKLEQLIVQADERIKELGGQESRIREPGVGDQENERVSEANPLAPDSRPLTPHSRPLPPDPDLRHTEIYALADAGQSVGEIARTLSRPRGEVELILALRQSNAPDQVHRAAG